MLKLVYGDAAVTMKTVYKWFKPFCNGCESVEDEERSGRPSTSKIQENLVNKSPTRCSLFHFIYFRSTCFGHGACPSSGVVCKNCRGT